MLHHNVNDPEQNVVATSMGGSVNGGKVSARLLGSTMSGVTELMIFHPVDTIAKRLMTNRTAVRILRCLMIDLDTNYVTL